GLVQILNVDTWDNAKQSLEVSVNEVDITNAWIQLNNEKKKPDEKKKQYRAFELGEFKELNQPIKWTGSHQGIVQVDNKTIKQILRQMEDDFVDSIQRMATTAVDRFIYEHIKTGNKNFEVRSSRISILDTHATVKYL
ncbi:MAG: hypothetical protein GY938_13675, partial [Ketobacter sp.]|nr:hypothetical protein [Ketobacter sp.]